MASLPQVPTKQEPQLSYRSKRKFEMKATTFPSDVDEKICEWVHKQIETRKRQLEQRHKKKVPEWRRIAEGRPREESKSWPFPNCANLVHAVVAEASDNSCARVMQSIWSVAPVIWYRYFTKSKDQQEAEHNSSKARLLEQAMDYFAYEPGELDLYEKENIWFKTSCDIGTGWVCVVPEQRVEAVFTGYDNQKKGTNFENDTLYEGPRVLNLRDEDTLYDPSADSPEESEFFARRVTLTRRQLQEREFKGLYKKGSVSKILNRPDRYGPDLTRRRQDKNKGIDQVEEQSIAEWDIHECYFYWYHNRKKFRLISWFHYESKTMMNQVFNFIPDNQLPIVRTRLYSGEKGMNGRGLADIGEHIQEEVSTTKCQRIDMTTWVMLGLNRISTSNRNIDRNFKLFPGSTLPFGEKEFEHYNVGDPAAIAASQRNEEMMLQQARERFGIGPAVSGAGAGGPIDKKGRFGSMGTFSVLQDSNTPIAHRTSDFRHSHVKLFGILTDMYGAMGLGRKGSLYGLDDQLLEEALNDYLERRVKIPIRASTASANREVTKQNELLLNQALAMHVKETSTMIQAVMNGSIPNPFYKKWLIGVIKSRTRIMQQIVRDFQISDQPEEYVPNVEFPPEVEGAPQGGQAQPKGINPAIIEMANRLRQSGGVPVPGGQSGVAGDNARPEGLAPGSVV